jgi:hypothetical protein
MFKFSTFHPIFGLKAKNRARGWDAMAKRQGSRVKAIQNSKRKPAENRLSRYFDWIEQHPVCMKFVGDVAKFIADIVVALLGAAALIFVACINRH